MCGRFSLAADPPTLTDLFLLNETPALSPRYNIAPTQTVAVVRPMDNQATRRLNLLHWGLIPSWAKDPRIGARMINARAETVAEKPAFRSAFRRKRCLVPADGFYEWVRSGSKKQPYHIRMRDGTPFAFAGLWERWEGPEGAIESCTLVTTEPNDLLRSLHHRMPVILARDRYAVWLDPDCRSPELLQTCMAPYPPENMVAYPVGLRVNNPRNDDPGCRDPREEAGANPG